MPDPSTKCREAEAQREAERARREGINYKSKEEREREAKEAKQQFAQVRTSAHSKQPGLGMRGGEAGSSFGAHTLGGPQRATACCMCRRRMRPSSCSGALIPRRITMQPWGWIGEVKGERKGGVAYN